MLHYYCLVLNLYNQVMNDIDLIKTSVLIISLSSLCILLEDPNIKYPLVGTHPHCMLHLLGHMYAKVFSGNQQKRLLIGRGEAILAKLDDVNEGGNHKSMYSALWFSNAIEDRQVENKMDCSKSVEHMSE